MKGLRITRIVGFSAAAGLITAALLVVALASTGEEAGAGVELQENGIVVAESLAADDAIAEASQKVGFSVKVPQSLPAGLSLKSVRADVGPIGPDQDGVTRDLSWVRSVTLQYRDDAGRILEIDQLVPEKKIGGPAESKPVDPGVQGVEALVLQRENVTYLTWDSSAASYLARYVHSDASIASGAEQALLAVLGSMR